MVKYGNMMKHVGKYREIWWSPMHVLGKMMTNID
jgi:hypothetical protein